MKFAFLISRQFCKKFSPQNGIFCHCSSHWAHSDVSSCALVVHITNKHGKLAREFALPEIWVSSHNTQNQQMEIFALSPKTHSLILCSVHQVLRHATQSTLPALGSLLALRERKEQGANFLFFSLFFFLSLSLSLSNHSLQWSCVLPGFFSSPLTHQCFPCVTNTLLFTTGCCSRLTNHQSPNALPTQCDKIRSTPLSSVTLPMERRIRRGRVLV